MDIEFIKGKSAEGADEYTVKAGGRVCCVMSFDESLGDNGLWLVGWAVVVGEFKELSDAKESITAAINSGYHPAFIE